MPGWNIALRLLLELAALAGLGWAGYHLVEGWPRLLPAIALPLVGAVLWGTFNVPGDPSRSGRAPVPVKGAIRLLIEMVVLFGGAAGFFFAGAKVVGAVLAALIVLHLAFSTERLRWVLEH